MSGGNDLTRWNRAGLTRFRYVDGNAATFLEELRLALLVRYIDPGALVGPEHADVARWKDLWRSGSASDPGLQSQLASYEAALAWPELWQAPPLSAESAAQRLERLVEAYQGERGDWGREITRALSRACHVLTEHLDAYANEGYLGTATQWDNVRRLVELLDYHPAPPASASTPLVIVTKGEAGTLERGWPIQHSPPAGGAPVVFETLEDLEMDPAVNTLRPASWNSSPETFGRLIASVDRPVGELQAAAVRGVEEVHAQRLDDYKRATGGNAAAIFTVADFWSLDPARAAVDISRIRLQEFKSKAEEVLAFPWSRDPLAAILDDPLAQVGATSAAVLAGRTGRPEAEMEGLRRALRRVQLALDDSAFVGLLVRDLVNKASPVIVSPWIAPEDSGISAGQVGVMVGGPRVSETAAVLVRAVDSESAEIALEEPPGQIDWRGWTKGETILHVKPGFIERPRLNGPGAVTFQEAHGLSEKAVVAWRDPEGQWAFDTVAEADDQAVRLEGDGQPSPAADVFRAMEITRGQAGLLFPDTIRVAARSTSSGPKVLEGDAWEPVEPPPGAVPVPGARYRRVTLADATTIFVVPTDAQAVSRVASPRAGESVFDGKPGKLASGQWVVAHDGVRLWPLRIVRITEAEDHYAVGFGLAGPPPVGSLEVGHIQGIAEHSGALAQAGVTTVGDLARPGVLDLEIASLVPLWELVTKARTVLAFPGDPDVLTPILGRTLAAIVDAPNEDLAKDLSQPEATVAELKEELRWIQACLDEATFRDLELWRLLPASAGAVSTDPAPLPEQVVRVYGLFEHTLRPEGYNRNPRPIAGSHIDLELAELPRLLSPGRRLVIEKEDRDGFRSGAFEARVVALHPSARAIDIDPPVPVDGGFAVGNLVLSGNVVPAGHGEARPERVLGSGDATRSGQAFVLKEEAVSFVADPTQPSGVKATAEIMVEGRTWMQVANLRDSGPADPHYAVRMTEDGHLKIQFGDGRRGRRLPTGANNVRARFRVGTGLEGKLEAGSLTEPARPHRRVDSVRQPLAATGGNDMEPVQSLRENAPASLLTLERAVSLADFGLLAARQASVWQARAFALPTGPSRHESVEVVVVPAGGGALGGLGESLRRFLEAHALPGVEIQISPAHMLAFDLSVTARVKSAEYDPGVVLEAVRTALLNAFSLRSRKLGQDLFLSEIYKVVEEVRGVENSACVLEDDAALRRKPASEREVFHLDPAASTLTLEHEEYQL